MQKRVALESSATQLKRKEGVALMHLRKVCTAFRPLALTTESRYGRPTRAPPAYSRGVWGWHPLQAVEYCDEHALHSDAIRARLTIANLHRASPTVRPSASAPRSPRH